MILVNPKPNNRRRYKPANLCRYYHSFYSWKYYIHRKNNSYHSAKTGLKLTVDHGPCNIIYKSCDRKNSIGYSLQKVKVLREKHCRE